MKLRSKFIEMQATLDEEIIKGQATQQALEKCHSRFRILMEDGGAIISIIDAKGVFRFMNHTAAQDLGYTNPHELFGKSLWNLFPKPQADNQFQVIEQVFSQGEKISTEIISIVQQEERHYDVNAAPFHMMDSDELCALVICRDITERKMVQYKLQQLNKELEATITKRTQDLQTSENRFRSFFEFSPTALWIEDITACYTFLKNLPATGVDEYRALFNAHPDYLRQAFSTMRIIEANPAALDLFEVDDLAALNTHLSTIKISDQQPFIEQAICLVDQTAEYCGEIQLKTAHNTSIELLIHWAVLDQKDDHTIHLLMSLMNITQHKKAEKQLYQAALSRELGAVVEITDQLIQCETLDEVFSCTVNQVRSVLGLERCSIFLDNGLYIQGTYGTDLHGNTTDERTFLVQKDEQWSACFSLTGTDNRWQIMNEEQKIWNGTEMEIVRQGQTVRTPITRSDGKPIAVFFNDNAITGNPLDTVKQDALTLLCSLLGDIMERKTAEELLRKAEDAQKQLSARLIDIQEDERKQISHLLHDQMGQLLTLSRLELGAARGADKESDQYISKTLLHLDDILSTIRQIAVSLRPPMLDDMGLETALESLIEDYAESGRIEISLTRAKDMPLLKPYVETNIYRVVQEALTNVIRHACATSADIKLSISGSFLMIDIKDNGIGMENPSDLVKSGIGLLGMKERLNRCHGTLDVHSMETQGTHLHIELPLNKVQQMENHS